MIFSLEQNALETSAAALDQFRVGCVFFTFRLMRSRLYLIRA